MEVAGIHNEKLLISHSAVNVKDECDLSNQRPAMGKLT